MNAPATPYLVHIGPMRHESKTLLKQIALPTLVITPMPESPTHKGMQDDLKYVSAEVAPLAGEATRYSFNLPGFDSLSPASGLKSLYPGVAETQRKSVETQPLNELISEHCPSGTYMTHLVLEQPEQALSLLQAWQEEGILDDLEGLFVRTSPISLYEGMPTRAELIAWCQQYGFDASAEKIDPDSREDPEFILFEFKRNALHMPLKAAQEKEDTLKQECDSLKKKLSEYEKLLKENANQLTKAAAALRETDTQLKESTKLYDEKTVQAENATKECDKLKQQLSKKESTITQLREELASQHQNQKVIQSRFEALESKLEGKLESLLREQRSYIQQTSNALGQHVTRIAHQQRNELALNHYIQYGQRLINSDLDSDYALVLLEKYHSQRYNVSLVFGSSTITELLAQTIIKAGSSNPQLMSNGHSKSLVKPAEDDLPTSIISFEHQRTKCETLKKRLEASHCSQVVNLVHAPWVEIQYQNKPELFYAVEDTFMRLNQWLPEEANILVVIGSTLAEAGHRCIVALSHLLQYFPTHSMEIVVEDVSSLQKAQLKADWEALLFARQRMSSWQDFYNTLVLKV